MSFSTLQTWCRAYFVHLQTEYLGNTLVPNHIDISVNGPFDTDDVPVPWTRECVCVSIGSLQVSEAMLDAISKLRSVPNADIVVSFRCRRAAGYAPTRPTAQVLKRLAHLVDFFCPDDHTWLDALPPHPVLKRWGRLHVELTTTTPEGPLPNLSRIAALVKGITLRGFEQDLDLSPLADNNCRHVILADCPHVTSVAHLAHADSVCLHNCDGITEVSPLARVDKVRISGCRNVSDLWTLAPVLDEPFDKVANVFGRVNQLCLSHLPQIEHLDGLGTIASVHVAKMLFLRDVEGLGTCNQVVLRECPGVTSVAALAGMSTLTLHRMHGITDLSPLCNVRHLTVRACANVTETSDLDAESLDLSFCTNLRRLGSFRNCRRISVSNCYLIDDASLAQLADIDSIDISHCYRIRDASVLKRVKNLNCSHCHQLVSLPASRRLKNLNMVACVSTRSLPPHMPSLERVNTTHCIDLDTSAHPALIQVVSDEDDVLVGSF